MMTKQARKTKTGADCAIVRGKLFIEDALQCKMTDEIFQELLDDATIKAIRIETLSSDWHSEVWGGMDYYNVEANVEMTVRKEIRSGKAYWYAYRRAGGKLYKKYIGQGADFTELKIARVAASLPG